MISRRRGRSALSYIHYRSERPSPSNDHFDYIDDVPPPFLLDPSAYQVELKHMNLHTSQDLREQGYDAADFCSTKQAATLLGVSHRTVQLWVESGVLQAWKTAGGHRRIMLASVKRLVDQRSQAIQRPLAHAQTPAQRKVLLVDDDPTSLRLYEFEVKSWGLPLQVLKASNGLEALIKIGESRPGMLRSLINRSGLVSPMRIRASKPLLALSTCSGWPQDLSSVS